MTGFRLFDQTLWFHSTYINSRDVVGSSFKLLLFYIIYKKLNGYFFFLVHLTQSYCEKNAG